LRTCPVECKILAPPIIDEISKGRRSSEFVNPAGGAFMDLTSVIALVTTVANLAVGLLQLRNEMARMRSERVPEDKLIDYHRSRLVIAHQDFQSLPEERRRAVIRVIFPEFRD